MRREASPPSGVGTWRAVRCPENPLITPYMLGDAGENINGPSLVKMPEWADGRLGAYHLYFGNHEGEYIRLAYADALRGPWKIHTPGVLPLSELPWPTDHLASPDVLVDEEQRRILLYFHCPTAPMLKSTDPDYLSLGGEIKQESFVAASVDGLRFTASPEALGPSYFRVWRRQGVYYALPRQGRPLLRSPNGYAPFETLPSPLEGNPAFDHIRHVAVLAEGERLFVCYSRIGDAPECLYLTSIEMRGEPEHWKAAPPCVVLRPETGYEGEGLPAVASRFGMTLGFEKSVRDPYLYKENNRLYLLYSVVAERGIALAELERTGD